jgi:hypothetical protein
MAILEVDPVCETAPAGLQDIEARLNPARAPPQLALEFGLVSLFSVMRFAFGS